MPRQRGLPPAKTGQLTDRDNSSILSADHDLEVIRVVLNSRRIMKKCFPLAWVVGGLLLVCGCESLPPQPPPEPMVSPQLAPPVANLEVTLDLSRHYDITCRDSQTTKVYTDCRIVGFAGSVLTGPQGMVATDGYFDHWLVIELPDGHRVFLAPGSIAYLEETRKAK